MGSALTIGFTVFLVHLATIPIPDTGISPARSFSATVIHNNSKFWDDHVRNYVSLNLISVSLNL